MQAPLPRFRCAAALAGAALLLALPGPTRAQPLQAGELVVTDRLADAVIRIDPVTGDQSLLASGFRAPRGVALDGFGNVLFGDSVSDLVARIVPGSGVIGVADQGLPPFDVPEDMLFAPDDRLLVAEAAFQAVLRLDPVAGDTEFFSFDPGAPFPDGTLGFPEGLALAADGTLYITDTATIRPSIYRTHLSSPVVFETVLQNDQTGPLLTPKDVVIEPGGSLLVADRFAGKVFRVPDPGAASPQLDVVAESPTLQGPVGLALLPGGGFWVTDFDAGALLRFDASGVLQQTISGGNLIGPWRLAVVGSAPPFTPSDLLVVDGAARALYRVTPDPVDPGVATRSLVTQDGLFDAPTGVSLDVDGTALVCDAGAPPALLRVDAGVQSAVSTAGSFIAPNRAVVERVAGSEVHYLVADPAAVALLRVRVNGGVATQQVVVQGAPFDEPVAVVLDRDGIAIVANVDPDVDGDGDYVSLIRVNPQTGATAPLLLRDPSLGSPVQAREPVDLAIDANHDVLLADRFTEPVQRPDGAVFRVHPVTGEVGKSYTSPLFGALQGIAVDLNRDLLVTDAGDPGATPAVPASLIRVDPGSGTAFVVSPGDTWQRPDGVALEIAASPPALADADGDAVGDSSDNCRDVANPEQRDTNGDGLGNLCDADYDNDGIVTITDFSALSAAFGSALGEPEYDPDIDADGDDLISIVDFSVLSSSFGGTPGPGLPGCDGTTSALACVLPLP